MSETHDLARCLFNDITVTGSLTDAAWQTFQQRHSMTIDQREAVLLSTLRHVLTMTGELQAEMNRLAAALHRYTG